MEVYQVVWTDNALKELYAIRDFIQKQSDTGAAKTVQEITNLAGSLNTMPERGQVERSISKRMVYRYLKKWNYKIIYTIEEGEKRVVIVKIFNTRQHPDKLKV